MDGDIKFEQEIHARMLARDVTASEELARKYLPFVEKHVRSRAFLHGIQDVDVINDATVDAVFDYIRHPEKFDPKRSGLLGYLKRAAERDLINELQKDRRRRRGEELQEDVELSILKRNKSTDIDRIRRDAETEMISRLEENEEFKDASRGSNSRDQALLNLLRNGERATSEFAAVLGIQHLPIIEQRHIVKQHKDRLKVQLKRHGSKHRDRK